MSFSFSQPFPLGAESGEDAQTVTARVRAYQANIQEQLKAVGFHGDPAERARLLLELARTENELQDPEEAWHDARKAFFIALDLELWPLAIQAAETLFETSQPESIAALGHAIWLSVTYPVEPELSLAILQHFIEDTPDNADGAAVAAATACYLVELRTEPDSQEQQNLSFFANQLLGSVARRHSQINTQAEFEAWVQRLELDNPERFLPRLSLVVNALVGENWWIDRDALRERLPVN